MAMNSIDDKLEVRLAAIYSRALELVAEEVPGEWLGIREEAKQVLENSATLDVEDVANKAWFLYTLIDANIDFIDAFGKIKSENYYEAWCKLERIEINLSNLIDNQFYDFEVLRVKDLALTVSNWQALYPYAVFLSPEMIIKREICSICGLDVNPWSKCSHISGKVYTGKFCYRIVKEMSFLGISLVHTPVQKYSVAFTSDEEGNTVDHYDYSIVKFAADRLQSAFDTWSYYWTTAHHPHSLFSDIKPTDGCPCESGREYRKCCLMKPGVVRPHIEFEFEKPFSSSLPKVSLGGYKGKETPIRIANSHEGVQNDNSESDH